MAVEVRLAVDGPIARHHHDPLDAPGEGQTGPVTGARRDRIGHRASDGDGSARFDEGWATAALALAVAVPLVVSGIRLAASGWVPTLDDGVILTRSFDVLSGRSPHLGQFSLIGGPGSAPTHSPGPMLYWLLAAPARFGPAWTVPVFMGLVNGALFAVVVVLARRRAGATFAAVTAIGLLLLMRAIGVVTLVEIWNPWASLSWFLALLFLAWSVADGDRHLLPAVAVVASLVMQTHLTYLAPAGLLVVVAVVCGWGGDAIRRLQDRGRSTASRAATWWPLAASAGLVAVCWALPLSQEATGRPGNLTLVARAGRAASKRGGLDAVRASLGQALGVPPRFARPHTVPLPDILEGIRPGSALGQVTAVLVVLVTIAAGAAGIRSRDRTVATGAVLGLALVGAMVVVAASLPLDRGLVAGYSLQWFRIAGLFLWLILGLAAARWLPRTWVARPAPTWTWSRARRPQLVAVAVPLAAAIVLIGLVLPRDDPAASTYDPARTMADGLDRATRAGNRYRVRVDGPYELAYLPALVWNLRRGGRDPVVRSAMVSSFGDAYGPRRRRCREVVILQRTSLAMPAGGRTVARIEFTRRSGLPSPARLVLAPDRTDQGAC